MWKSGKKIFQRSYWRYDYGVVMEVFSSAHFAIGSRGNFEGGRKCFGKN